MAQSPRSLPATLARACANLECWRRTRRRGRIPDRFWQEAVDVALTDGVERTAEALRLDPDALRRKLPTDEAPLSDAPRLRRCDTAHGAFRRRGRRRVRAAGRRHHSIVHQARAVDAVVIDDERLGQCAEVDEVVPVAVVAGKPRGLHGEHGTGLPLADSRYDPVEARALLRPRARTSVVVVDDLGPEAEMLRVAPEIVLARWLSRLWRTWKRVDCRM